MTVEGNVGYGLRMKRVPKAERRRRVREMVEIVRLSDFIGHRPGELSGGMQQRVALARALVNRPSVLLLDEPLGSLDRKLREDMQIELRQLHTALGTTFIYVTHDQDEALSMSDRVVIMREGRIEQQGTPAEVYDDPATLWAATFVGSSNLISGTVRSVGAQVVLETDVAVVVSDHPAVLSAGERAVAVVRPDDVQCTSVASAGDATNCVKGRLAEMLTVGKQVKLVAETAGGLEIVARVSRSERRARHSGGRQRGGAVMAPGCRAGISPRCGGGSGGAPVDDRGARARRWLIVIPCPYHNPKGNC